MARGNARAPSQNAFRGAVGRTQTALVHVTTPAGDLAAVTVHTSIDAVSDPELAQRLQADEPAKRLNVVGDRQIAVPILYHDPAAELMVLVLDDSQRHRELDERIALIERLRADDTPIPAYAKDFAVVFGAAGLRTYLERRAGEALERVTAQRAQDAAKEAAKESAQQVERKQEELAKSQAELAKAQGDLAKSQAELAKAKQDISAAQVELARARTEIAAAKQKIAEERGKLDRDRAQLAKERAEAEAALERMRAEQRARVIKSVQQPPAEKPAEKPAAEKPAAEKPAAEKPIATARPAAEKPIATAKPAVQPAAVQLTAVQPAAAQPAAVREPEPPIAAREPVTLRDPEKPAPAAKPAAREPDKTVVAPPPSHDDERSEVLTAPVSKLESTEAETKQLHINGLPKRTEDSVASPVNFEDALTGEAIIPQGADPLTTETEELPAANDPWLEFAATGVTSSFEVKNGAVRLALLVGEQIARGLRGALDVRLLLHRLPQYPIASLVIGPPAALRVPSSSQLAVVALDIGTDLDHQVLEALAQRFAIDVAVVHRGVPVRHVRLVAPLEGNAGYLLTAADEHLRAVTADGEASFSRARDAVLAEGFDLLGVDHAEAAEFRDDKLAQLSSAHHLRRAIAVARRFAKPVREDYLVCSRGFPLARWHELRRHVLESAIEWGLWMGPELAQLAVADGLAPSRKELVLRLDTAFEALRSHPTAFDLDDDAADDNVKALTEEARAYGLDLHRKSANAIKSEDVPEVSGSIEGEPDSLLSATTPEQLVAMLDDKHQRVSAAAELCDRSIGSAAPAVIAAVKKMSRAEAVRILGKSVKLGAAAAPPLIEGLRSSKAFLRHGCALALALVRTDDGTRAIIELLLAEPTEVWREVARALGQVGPPALAALASHAVQTDLTPQLGERVAWAMAHVGARGGKSALEQLAAGQAPIAPLATEALALVETAARDELRVRPGSATKDVTVNRAFSRRFFEALDVGDKATLDISAPMELLDESDLIVDEEDAEDVLDVDDLIQT